MLTLRLTIPSRVTTRRTRTSSCGGAGAGGGITAGSGLAGGGCTARAGGGPSFATTTGVGLATGVYVSGWGGGAGRIAANCVAGALASLAAGGPAAKADAQAGH